MLFGLALLLVPEEGLRAIRGVARDLFGPGRRLVHGAETAVAGLLADPAQDAGANRIKGDATRGTSEQLTRLARENRRLHLEVARLRERTAQLDLSPGLRSSPSAVPALVEAELVPARVLGRENTVLWRGQKLLAQGALHGLQENALVLEREATLLDIGEDAGLEAGLPAYAGRVVVGRLAAVGRWSSSLQLVSDREFRGYARLARPTAQGLGFASEGILEGTGKGCELKYVPSTESVAVGDWVVTGDADGLLPHVMYYGEVAAAELTPAATHWHIRVVPAIDKLRITEVDVLRRNVNPTRVLAD